MGRIAEQAATERPPDVKRNKLDRILDSLDDDDREIVDGWLEDPELSDQAIELRLFAAEVDVSDSTIRQWRRRRGIRTVWAA